MRAVILLSLLFALFCHSSEGDWKVILNNEIHMWLLAAQHSGARSSRLFNGTNQYEGQLQLFINGTWRPAVCSSNVDSFTGNRLCQLLGFKVAVRRYDYPYTGMDAIYDYALCYPNSGTSRNLSDCYTTEHTAGQQCDSSATLGLVCSDGQYSYTSSHDKWLYACVHSRVFLTVS